MPEADDEPTEMEKAWLFELAEAQKRGDFSAVERIEKVLRNLREEEEDEVRSEEFDCPPGHVTVDVFNDNAVRGIYIHYFDPGVSDSDMLEHAMLPSKKQWDHVKEQVLEWLDKTLE